MGQALGDYAVGGGQHPMDEGGIVGIGGSDLIGASGAGLLHHGFYITVAVVGDSLVVQTRGGGTGGIAVIVVGGGLGSFQHQGDVIEVSDVGIGLIDAGNLNGGNRLSCVRDNREAGELPSGDIRVEGNIVIVLGIVAVGDHRPETELLGMVVGIGGAEIDIIRHGVCLSPAGEDIGLGAGERYIDGLRGVGVKVLHSVLEFQRLGGRCGGVDADTGGQGGLIVQRPAGRGSAHLEVAVFQKIVVGGGLAQLQLHIVGIEGAHHAGGVDADGGRAGGSRREGQGDAHPALVDTLRGDIVHCLAGVDGAAALCDPQEDTGAGGRGDIGGIDIGREGIDLVLGQGHGSPAGRGGGRGRGQRALQGVQTRPGVGLGGAGAAVGPFVGCALKAALGQKLLGRYTDRCRAQSAVVLLADTVVVGVDGVAGSQNVALGGIGGVGIDSAAGIVEQIVGVNIVSCSLRAVIAVILIDGLGEAGVGDVAADAGIAACFLIVAGDLAAGVGKMQGIPPLYIGKGVEPVAIVGVLGDGCGVMADGGEPVAGIVGKGGVISGGVGDTGDLIAGIGKGGHGDGCLAPVLLHDGVQLAGRIIHLVAVAVVILAGSKEVAVVASQTGEEPLVVHSIGHGVGAVAAHHDLKAKTVLVVIHAAALGEIVDGSVAVTVFQVGRIPNGHRLNFLDHIQRPAGTEVHRKTQLRWGRIGSGVVRDGINGIVHQAGREGVDGGSIGDNLPGGCQLAGAVGNISAACFTCTQCGVSVVRLNADDIAVCDGQPGRIVCSVSLRAKLSET